jgi:ABC-type glycerol-3-phosphate transport system substrate-binding protein
MRTLRALALIPALGLALVACGSDDSTAGDTTSPSTQASTPVETTSAPETTGSAVETTVAGGETTTPGSVQSGPVQIDVVVGTDSGEDRIEKVTAGSEITLNITNPDADDEFHVHGIDLEQAAKKGEMATMNFTLDTPGTYEVESHITEDVLVIIEVS